MSGLRQTSPRVSHSNGNGGTNGSSAYVSPGGIAARRAALHKFKDHALGISLGLRVFRARGTVWNSRTPL